MKITKIETLHCDAGWRPWTFVKVATDDGITGWSECTDSHGSPHAIEGVVKDLSPLLLGQDPRNVERLYGQMYARTRQSPGSVVQKAIGGIENALLDVSAKSLGVPVHALFGGVVRDTLELYWSHCGTSRVRAWREVGKPRIASYDDLRAFGKEIRASGFKTVKTNIAVLGDAPYVYMPGFGKSVGGPELNVDAKTLGAIERWVGTLRDAVGDDVGIILDLNFNFKTEGYLRAGRMLEQYGLSWLEIDSYDPRALRDVKQALSISICSGENLYGIRQYRPYFESHAMDIASVDVIWNGFMRSRHIAAMADLYEMNVTPHNYNGHLATFISAQFAASIPNLRMMEFDVDDVPWRDELFTVVPKIENGTMRVPDGPGWGTEVNEKVLRAHPWPAQ